MSADMNNRTVRQSSMYMSEKATLHSSGRNSKQDVVTPSVTPPDTPPDTPPGKQRTGGRKQPTPEPEPVRYEIVADGELPRPIIVKKREEIKITQYSQCYLDACKILKIIPVTYFMRHVHDKIIKMKSHPLGLKGVRAVCIALVNNDLVETLDLADNAFGEDGALCIANMLTENDTITSLGLAENQIGSRGATAFCDLLKSGRVINTLNISGCGLDDLDAKTVADMIEFSPHLVDLNVSHNGICELGTIDIARAVALNKTLRQLDISWNHIRGKGAKAFATGLQKNVGLKDVNLSWNGLARDGAAGIGKALIYNRTLIFLDVTNNRFGMEDIGFILKGIQQNETLRVLKMGKNPITPDVAFTILTTIEHAEKSAIRDLDISDVVVRTDFVEKLEEIKTKRIAPLRVAHGAVVQGKQAPSVDPNGIDWRDPVMRMFKFMQDRGYRVIDLLKRLDKDRSLSVDREEFKAGLIAENIPMTEAQLDEVITILDTDKDGEVDLSELIKGEKDFRKKMKIRMKKMLEQMKAMESDLVLQKLAKLEEL